MNNFLLGMIFAGPLYDLQKFKIYWLLKLSRILYLVLVNVVVFRILLETHVNKHPSRFRHKDNHTVPKFEFTQLSTKVIRPVRIGCKIELSKFSFSWQ